MDHDALDVIAASYQRIDESTHRMAQATTQMVETQRRLASTMQEQGATQRLALRLQGVAVLLLGLGLLFTGYVVWQHLARRHENAALQQAVLTNTQTIAAQTQALLEMMRHGQNTP
jgi:uncharacterized membrane protein YqjE